MLIVKNQGSNWGGDKGLGHGTTGFWKMDQWTNFEKMAYIAWFFDFFRHFMHNYEIKSSMFEKLGKFSLKYRNF